MPRFACVSQCFKDALPPRDRIFVAKDDLPQELLSLLGRPGVLECAVLSTCIRFEIYALLKNDAGLPGPLADHLRESHGIAALHSDASFSVTKDADAVRHLYSVVCGLDSKIVGEKQIVGQVKDAYRAALDLGCTGPTLNRIFQRGLALSKRVRTRTGIDRGVCSAVSLAVRMLLTRYGELASRRVLVLGAGQMGKLAGLHLAAKGCRRICFASRSIENARVVAGQCAADSVEFGRFFETLRECDILVTATGAPHEIVGFDDVGRIMAERGGRELCIVDLADPPDVDPRVSSLENVVLFTIRCLNDLTSRTRINRTAAAREARSMIEEAVGDPRALVAASAAGASPGTRAHHSEGREP